MTTIDEWDTDRLDLDAYLARLGNDGELVPTGETLYRLHRAHVAAILFENLDIPLGRGVSTDLDDIEAKLVRAGRGGYCYEHGLLFAAALDRLGYRTSRLLARIGADEARPRPRTHMALHVRGDDGEWLADVGFGAGLLYPLPWGDTGPHTQGSWTYQLEPHGERGWQVTERHAHHSSVLYSIRDEPVHASDVEMANHFTATHPSSPFVGQPVVMRKDDHGHLRLRGRQLTEARPDGASTEHELTDIEFARVLPEEFGLHLTEQQTAELLHSLPALALP
jgi:N-hydroxyarylamine O-acetyltransferase